MAFGVLLLCSVIGLFIRSSNGHWVMFVIIPLILLGGFGALASIVSGLQDLVRVANRRVVVKHGDAVGTR